MPGKLRPVLPENPAASGLSQPGKLNVTTPENDLLDWIQEREWIGANCFIVIEVQTPWPSDIRVPFENSMPLDSQLLNRIAEFYEMQPSDSRAMLDMYIMIGSLIGLDDQHIYN